MEANFKCFKSSLYNVGYLWKKIRPVNLFFQLILSVRDLGTPKIRTINALSKRVDEFLSCREK